MSLLRKSAVGFAYNHIGKILDFGLAYLFGVVLARRLGAEGYGSYATLVSMSTLAVLFCSLGLDETLHRYVSQLSGEPGKVRYVVRRAVSVRLAGLTLLLVGLLACRRLLAGLFGLPHSGDLLLWLACYIAGLSLLNFFSSIFIARLRTGVNLVLFTAMRLLNLGGVVLLLAGTASLAAVLGLLAATALLTAMVLAYLARQDIFGPAEPFAVKRVWRFGLSVWGVGFLSLALGKQSDVLLLSAFWKGSAQIGYYEAAFSLLRLVGWSMTIGFSGVLLSTFSGLAEGRAERLSEARLLVIKFLQTLVLPLGLFMLFNSSSVIRLIYSDAYLPSARLFNVAIGFSLLSWAFGGGASQTVLYAVGQQNLVLRIRALYGGANLLVNFWIIPFYGAMGAITVTSVVGALNTLTEYFIANRFALVRFPVSYFAKVTLVSAFAVGVIRWAPRFGDGTGLLLVAVLYGGLIGLGYWLTRLLGEGELEMLRRLRLS